MKKQNILRGTFSLADSEKSMYREKNPKFGETSVMITWGKKFHKCESVNVLIESEKDI